MIDFYTLYDILINSRKYRASDNMTKEIEVSVKHLKRKKKAKKIIKLSLLFIFLFLLIAFIIMRLIYNDQSVSITLDKNLYFKNGIIIYDDPNYKVFRTELNAEGLEYFDNISEKWLADDLDNYDGSHNGDNYVAYTFYIENTGDKTSDYWSQLVIDGVIKNVDEAIRFRVYRNGVPTTYAKLAKNGNPEKGTMPFVDDNLVTFEHRENFKPGDIDKYTVVMWLEGTDIDCTDNLLGGELKVHMEFNSEFVDVNSKKDNNI